MVAGRTPPEPRPSSSDGVQRHRMRYRQRTTSSRRYMGGGEREEGRGRIWRPGIREFSPVWLCSYRMVSFLQQKSWRNNNKKMKTVQTNPDYLVFVFPTTRTTPARYYCHPVSEQISKYLNEFKTFKRLFLVNLNRKNRAPYSKTPIHSLRIIKKKVTSRTINRKRR